MTKEQGKAKQKLRSQGKRKVRQTVWIGEDPDLAERLRETEGRRRHQETSLTVRGADASDADRLLLQKLKEEEAEIRESLVQGSMKFVFEAVGRNRYDALMKEHPPTAEQIAEAKEDGQNISFNPETFVFALIDMACVHPEHEPGELAEWLEDDPDDEWNDAEVRDLFNAAISVNIDRSRVNLGKG